MAVTPGIQLITVDLKPFLSGQCSTKEARAIADELVRAYQEIGFVYTVGWEEFVPKELVERVFHFNQTFFDLPLEKKQELAYTTTEANRGYLTLGREGQADQKETFEIGNDRTPEYPERWPSEADVPGFKATMKEFHTKAHALNLKLMSLVALALDLDPAHFDKYLSKGENNLRMLHYPPSSSDAPKNRLAAHTDDGTITLLWQDFTGGLEVQGPDGNWRPVVPKEGGMLINVADVLERMSNDHFKSTRHRAVVPDILPGESESRARRSLAFFCNPNRDVMIECIPNLGEPKYEPVLAGKFYAAALAVGIKPTEPVAASA